MKDNITKPKGKIIRDAVHGDIFISDNFLKIIDTPEFQRLRRIRQLSTANMLFPTAEHTRFSHSIGCYHVMQLLIEHFRPILKNINVKIDDVDIELSLAAALLHDIGHGPFSHAFENALPNTVKQKKHEDWTTAIITSSESRIQQVLVEHFEPEFPHRLAELLTNKRLIKKRGLDRQQYNKIDLFFVLSSLISSQLDADRMDYLLRDSYFTGVPYGKIDLSRLINALTLTVSDNQYYVCVQEKYLPTIEDYVLARYQMHNGIYLHDFKCEMELILKKILYRAFELYKGNNLKRDNLPIAIIKTFEGQDMTVSDYVSLDDSVMLALFLNWKNGSDSLLSTLCATLLDRNKYRQIMILDNTDADIGEFKQKLKDLLSNNGYEVADYGREYFWLEDSVENNVYKKSKKNIWILKNDGSLKDLMDASALITDKLDEKKNIVFINIDVLKQNNKIQNIENVIDDINNLIRLFNRRNQIEIEKKYAFEDHQLFKKVEDGIRELGNYDISDIEPSYRQVDVYYDTADELLNQAGITLRIRKRNGKTILTIKTPTVNSVGKESREGQNERFEYEKELITDSLEEAKDHITKYIPALLAASKFSHLEPRMIIKNSRKKIKLTDQNIKFEMAFDDVQYERNSKSAHEYQIEIELKSDFIHRINLKMLTDYLEKNVPDLIPATVSKYRRGLSLTD